MEKILNKRDNQEKINLFDSLLVENQTILDTISQVKIANKMFSEENKILKEKLEKIKELWINYCKDNIDSNSLNEELEAILRENSQ